MNPQIISLVALVAAISLSIALVSCFRRIERARAQAADILAVTLHFEREINETKRDLIVAMQYSEDLQRRIAQLESTMRAMKSSPTQKDQTQSARNITQTSAGCEQRQQVLSLARRGEDAETIANLLKMPHGEVELIIGLNNLA